MSIVLGSGQCNHITFEKIGTVNCTVICPNGSSHTDGSVETVNGYRCTGCNAEVWITEDRHQCAADNWTFVTCLGFMNKPLENSSVTSNYIPKSPGSSTRGNMAKKLYSEKICEQCTNSKSNCVHDVIGKHEVCMHDKTTKHDE